MMSNRVRGLFDRLARTPEVLLSAVRMEVSRDLDRLVREEGISQSELAQRLGVSQPYVAKALGGSSNFTLKTLVKLALGLNASLHVRLTRRDEVLEVKQLEHPAAVRSGDASLPGAAIKFR